MYSLVIFLGCISFCVIGFAAGAFYSEIKHFNDIFNSQYILKAKNLSALEPLWRKVHTYWFYNKVLGVHVPDDVELFTKEEVEILGLIKTTFSRTPKPINHTELQDDKTTNSTTP